MSIYVKEKTKSRTHSTTPQALFLMIGLLALILLTNQIPVLAQGEEPPANGSDPLTRVVVESAEIPQGQEDLISVELIQDASAPGLVSYQGTLVYDPSVIEVLEVIFPEQCPVWAANIESGFIRFAATKCSGDPDDVKIGELFTLRVLAVGDPGSTTTLFPSFDIFIDIDTEDIPHEVEPGTITISGGNGLPVVDFTYRPRMPSVDDTIQFTDTSSDPDGTIISWLWDFGDGNQSDEQNPTHQYNSPGTYSVMLTVEDDAGGRNSTTKQIEVSDRQLPTGCPYNFPNPAVDHTNFYCSELPDGATNASLRIFNLRGELVKTHAFNITSGPYRWDLRDDRGNPLQNGPYFYYLRAETPNGVVRTQVEVLIIQR